MVLLLFLRQINLKVIYTVYAINGNDIIIK